MMEIFVVQFSNTSPREQTSALQAYADQEWEMFSVINWPSGQVWVYMRRPKIAL